MDVDVTRSVGRAACPGRRSTDPLDIRQHARKTVHQPRAAEDLTRLLEDGLKAANLEFAAVEAFAFLVVGSRLHPVGVRDVSRR